MVKVSRPSIVIPGIEGSILQNFYPIDPVTTWSTLTIVEGKLFALDFDTLAFPTTQSPIAVPRS